MTTQSEALRLADLLQDECGVDGYVHDEAAAELRRLAAVEAQRDALLEALAVVLLEAEHTLLEPTRRKARAAIKAVEEKV